ncbi:DUF4755 domain-containing protein [Klebsiella pneumoniae]|uniref:DUF4755 domain-containing protein n=1 Tax=Klebsiella pneumoniae TaxID=573 RepID=UPI00284FA84A|nr:DUF4755 domain-containing protein [Klebsiella pneumoniae]MCJ4065510.1 DUF4755 domain-containing protein [Klebsiella pneumoniae]MCJ5253771.1 DUF4755 domain-containing protein [Klebsiella pneumoniae]MDR4693334.1 DUF4755 domain-containing protein [Klebsiella pneumoniae]MDR4708624.1 DUF4755 domain-containing protein [Klebsiella pneumoniae]
MPENTTRYGGTYPKSDLFNKAFIRVKDVRKPEWHIRFYPRNSAFNSHNGLNDLKAQLNQWMEIFDQNLNAA